MWLFTVGEIISETDEIVCCRIGIDFIDFAWSPRDHLKKRGWSFAAVEIFSETDEIVCCRIGIDFIDFPWSARNL